MSGAFFTAVFRGDLRSFAWNPLHVDTTFGRPVALAIGDALGDVGSADIRAYNQGVADVLAIAARAAAAISDTSGRHVHEDFAVAALDELAQAGKALLKPEGRPS